MRKIIIFNAILSPDKDINLHYSSFMLLSSFNINPTCFLMIHFATKYNEEKCLQIFFKNIKIN